MTHCGQSLVDCTYYKRFNMRPAAQNFLPQSHSSKKVKHKWRCALEPPPPPPLPHLMSLTFTGSMMIQRQKKCTTFKNLFVNFVHWIWLSASFSLFRFFPVEVLCADAPVGQSAPDLQETKNIPSSICVLLKMCLKHGASHQIN